MRPRRSARRVCGVLLLLLVVAGVPTPALERAIDPAGSIFAIVTRKGGFAKGLAHDHLVAATEFRSALVFDADDPTATRFALEVPVEALDFDPPDARALHQDRLIELGLLEEPFTELKDKQRAKIRKSALGRKQLDAKNAPTLRAEILGIVEQPDDAAFPFAVRLAVEIRGTRVEGNARARYVVVGDAVEIEAFGGFNFTDFGIKPYSAALGAVRNKDAFGVYVRLIAR